MQLYRFSILPIILFSLSFIVNSVAQSGNLIDQKNGFKSYRIESTINDYADLKFDIVENGKAKEIKIEKKEYIGDIPTKEIRLFFVEDILLKIEISFESAYSFSLKKACKEAYGDNTSDKWSHTHLFEEPVATNSMSWKGDKLSLVYSYRKEHPFFPDSPNLRLIYAVNDYSESLEKAKKQKKFSINDF
jgi:hypothetical protein